MLNNRFLGGQTPGGKAVLHYDTVQSRGDHYHMMMRALRRADLKAPPSWFSSYSLTLQDPAERRAAISAMALKAAANGGLHSLFIDGGADLVFDVNDLKEACSLVTELHQLATETCCVIVTALHHNPGGKRRAATSVARSSGSRSRCWFSAKTARLTYLLQTRPPSRDQRRQGPVLFMGYPGRDAPAHTVQGRHRR